MRIKDVINEGGWDTTHTQGTVITPPVVRAALDVMATFTTDFNIYLKKTRAHGPVKLGRPTGSTAHYQADLADPRTHDKIYGDIDLQMVGPDLGVDTQTKYTNYWNQQVTEWIHALKPAYVHSMESVGHPIIKVGKDASGDILVQVDLMWHSADIADWGASRVTPERGVKGLLHGNMFSVLGQLLDMSIQHAGVQLKTLNGQHVPFSKQKDTRIETISTDPRNFIMNIFQYEYQAITGQDPKGAKIDPLLAQNPGNDPDTPKIERLVRGIQGLARSFEANGLFGQGDLAQYSNAGDFMTRFENRYEEKALGEIASAKRDKAATPQAIARAEDDKKKIMQGLKYAKGLFQ
jgi:hypothetical protein